MYTPRLLNSQITIIIKGDAMNLRRIFCVLELIILVFRVLCIKYVTKCIKFPFIWHTVRLCSLISVGVTGKSVKNQFFDFSQFCQKNIIKMECQNFCQYCHFSCKNGTQKRKNKRESTLQRKMEMDYQVWSNFNVTWYKSTLF